SMPLALATSPGKLVLNTKAPHVERPTWRNGETDERRLDDARNRRQTGRSLPAVDRWAAPLRRALLARCSRPRPARPPQVYAAPRRARSSLPLPVCSTHLVD